MKRPTLARLVRLFGSSAPVLWLLGPSGVVLAQDTQPAKRIRAKRLVEKSPITRKK
jgi:hypothetical protein